MSRQVVSTASEDVASVKASQLDQSEDISQMLEALSFANESLRVSDRNLDAIGQEQSRTAKNRILSWVYTSVDPSISFNNAIKGREPETGLWFLESEHFAKWTRSTKLLWLTGIRKCFEI
jgi:hypothetical protein